MNYLDPGAPDGELVDSYNPDADAPTSAVLFDPEGDLRSASSASLPLQHVRAAVAERCRTRARPDRGTGDLRQVAGRPVVLIWT